MVGLLTKQQKQKKYGKIRGKGGERMQLKYHMVTIEDLVPEEHLLRKVDAASYAVSTSDPPATHSPSSSRTRIISPPPRLSTHLALKRLNERLRVIFAKNIRNTLGFCGGMAFHVWSQVSLTHSSESSAQCRMLSAIVKQYGPYLLAVSDMASAFFCQYSSTI